MFRCAEKIRWGRGNWSEDLSSYELELRIPENDKQQLQQLNAQIFNSKLIDTIWAAQHFILENTQKLQILLLELMLKIWCLKCRYNKNIICLL